MEKFSGTIETAKFSQRNDKKKNNKILSRVHYANYNDFDQKGCLDCEMKRKENELHRN